MCIRLRKTVSCFSGEKPMRGKVTGCTVFTDRLVTQNNRLAVARIWRETKQGLLYAQKPKQGHNNKGETIRTKMERLDKHKHRSDVGDSLTLGIALFQMAAMTSSDLSRFSAK